MTAGKDRHILQILVVPVREFHTGGFRRQIPPDRSGETMNKTGIPYLDMTWNPTHGCDHISPGCDNCWARTMAKRLAGAGSSGYDNRGPFLPTEMPEKLGEPARKRQACRIGVSFMGDLLHPSISTNFILRVFQACHAAQQHDYLFLTKRPSRINEAINAWFTSFRLPIDSRTWMLKNWWFGVTVENQEMADLRLQILRDLPVATKWISIEPILRPINLGDLTGISWVVCGCESGPGRRVCNIDWVRSVRDQCAVAGVPFFLKQMEVGSKVISMPTLDGEYHLELPR